MSSSHHVFTSPREPHPAASSAYQHWLAALLTCSNDNNYYYYHYYHLFILLFFLDSAYQNSVRQLEDARLLWEKEMEQCCEVRFFDVFAH